MATKTKQKKSPSVQKNTKGKFSKETYIKWYRDMLLIRKFEEKDRSALHSTKFGGFCHLYIGQEAIVVGTASACEPGDKHMTAYRHDHGHPIALGTDPRVLMAELMDERLDVQRVKVVLCTSSINLKTSWADMVLWVHKLQWVLVLALLKNIKEQKMLHLYPWVMEQYERCIA